MFASFGPNAIAKAGGKAFDIEVDVRDPYAFDLLESVNDINRNQKEMLETISQVQRDGSAVHQSFSCDIARVLLINLSTYAYLHIV